jgi:hypothetical protein
VKGSPIGDAETKEAAEAMALTVEDDEKGSGYSM